MLSPHPLRPLLLLLAGVLSAAEGAADKGAAPAKVDTRGEAGERSAVLVTRSTGNSGRGFAAVLAPKVAAQAAESGIAVSTSEVGEQAETQQVADARSRGASYLIDVDVTSFSSREVTLLGQPVRRLSANLTWRVLDISANAAAVGSGQAGDSSVSDTLIAEDEQVATFSAALAKKVGGEIVAKLGAAKAKQPQEWPVQVRIKGDDLSFPNLVIDDNHVVRRAKEPLGVELTGFTLACDGVVVGTVPSATPVNLPRGLRSLTLERPGFETWKGRVDVREGLVLEPAIRPTEESLARWRSQTAFLQGLSDGTKLSDAEAEKVRGAAESLRNSGFRVRIDAKELPQTVITPPR